MTKPSPKFYLRALELENFQSIIDPVRIEFADLTLLFGPNSAGKSAVFDALELIHALWNPNKASTSVITGMLDKWAHIPKQKEVTRRSIRVAIEIASTNIDPKDKNQDFSTSTINRSYRSLKEGEALWGYFQYVKILRFEYEAFQENRQSYWRISKVNISELKQEDGKMTSTAMLSATRKLLESQSDADHFLIGNSVIEIAIPHREYSNLPRFPIISKDEFRNIESPSLVDVESEFIFTKAGLPDCSIISSNWIFGREYADEHLENSSGFSGSREFMDTYLDHVCYFGGMLCYILEDAFPTIIADRRIPAPNDLLTMHSGLDLNGIEGWHVGLKEEDHSLVKMVSERMPLQNYYYKKLSELARLRKIIHHPMIYTEYPTDEAREADDQEIADYSIDLIKLDRINRYLSDYLFVEKGYQIDCDILFVSPADFILHDATTEDVVRHPTIACLRLVDNDGRSVEIQDVGSGIPFVLPVLVSISMNNISTIQQPELHLHPALQSSLADIFIDRIRENTTTPTNMWQAVVETHSEHFLLRLLRRIRETELGSIDTPLSLRPEEVAIYYFNPIPGGTTEVRKMLISPLGDFYNTWPRGFFDERNDDLFK